MRAFKKIKLIIILTILLFLDTTLPYGYDFYPELLFIGIIFLSLKSPPSFAFVSSVSFGMLKDILSYSPYPFAAIEFAVISMIICRFSRFFLITEKTIAAWTVKSSIIIGSLLLHSAVNSLTRGTLPAGLIFYFLLQSYAISLALFPILNRILEK